MVNTENRLIIFFAAKDGEALYSQQKEGRELAMAQYDLNQIPYDYTVEVRNRFKGLDLIDIVPDELWTEALYRRQGLRPSPRKRKAKRKNGCLRRPSK